MEKNIAHIYTELTENQRRLLFTVLKQYSEPHKNLTFGAIPFVSQSAAIKAIDEKLKAEFPVLRDDNGSRIGYVNLLPKRLRSLREKLKVPDVPYARFEMYLDDLKIFKFSSHNKRTGSFEVRLKRFKNENAGSQYQYFGNKFVQPQVSKEIVAVLKRKSKNVWEVKVDAKFKEHCVELLLERFVNYDNDRKLPYLKRR